MQYYNCIFKNILHNTMKVLYVCQAVHQYTVHIINIFSKTDCIIIRKYTAYVMDVTSSFLHMGIHCTVCFMHDGLSVSNAKHCIVICDESTIGRTNIAARQNSNVPRTGHSIADQVIKMNLYGQGHVNLQLGTTHIGRFLRRRCRRPLGNLSIRIIRGVPNESLGPEATEM